LSKKEDKEKKPDILDIFNIKVFGIDFREILKGWPSIDKSSEPTNVNDLSLLEELRRRIKEVQDLLKKRFGDVVRFDYDIRVRSLVDEREIRIARGSFFKKLDMSVAGGVKSKVRETTSYKQVRDMKKPPIDVIDCGDHLEVVIEIPGVDERDVKLRVKEDRLSLSTAEGSERKYSAEVILPSKVEPSPFERKYHNGILRVKFRKKLY